MNKFILLFLIIFPSWLHGAALPTSPPLITWSIFPGGVQAVDGSVIAIVANGIHHEISLNGDWPEGKSAKKILADLISSKRTEVRIYGKDEQCRDIAILFADWMNINAIMIKKGFKQKLFLNMADKCSSNYDHLGNKIDPSIKIRNTVRNENGSPYPHETSSTIEQEIDTSGRTVSVKGYYRRDGTYVRSHKRSPPGTRLRRSR